MLNQITKPLNLAVGRFFICEFSAKGGVVYRRIGEESQELREDESMTAEYSTRKEVDHVGLQTWSRKIIQAAYNIMDKYCSATPVGYWISEDRADQMLAELAQVKMEASKLNGFARTVRSNRRVAVEVYSLSVGQESLEQVATRLAETVRERLDGLRVALFNGDLNSYTQAWKRAKNLPRLATGIQAEAIVLALEAAKDARGKLTEAIKNKQEPTKAGSELDLMAIESAIVLFTDSVNGNLAMVEDDVAA